MNNKAVKPFSELDLQRAVDDLSMLRFFPGDPTTQAAIGKLLVRICPHREALRWLVETFVNRIGEWKGPAELRAVLCTRYQPHDGVEAWSQIAGFTAADGEERSYAEHRLLVSGGITAEVYAKRPLEIASSDPEMQALVVHSARQRSMSPKPRRTDGGNAA